MNNKSLRSGLILLMVFVLGFAPMVMAEEQSAAPAAPEAAAPAPGSDQTAADQALSPQDAKKAARKKRKLARQKSKDQADLYLPDSALSTNADVPDYLEPMNRAVFGFNQFLDRNLLHPVATFYRNNVPEQEREMAGNFMQNLATPVVFVNSILQGDIDYTYVTFWRFFVNTTIGVGGLFDEAEDMGLPYRKEDFGQTLGTYGVGHGTYLVLPIIGPSSLRDAGGMVVDLFFDPINYVPSDYDYVPYVVDGVRVLQGRTEALGLTDTINKVSLDPYATYRSGYAQRRAEMVRESGGIGPDAKNTGEKFNPTPEN